MIKGNDRCEFVGQIMDCIEDFLTSKGVRFPENKELMLAAGYSIEEAEDAADVVLLGENYDALATSIKTTLNNWHVFDADNDHTSSKEDVMRSIMNCVETFLQSKGVFFQETGISTEHTPGNGVVLFGQNYIALKEAIVAVFIRWEIFRDPKPFKEKSFLVQIKDDEGLSVSIKTECEIIRLLDMADCYPEALDIYVFDISKAGHAIPVEIHGCWSDLKNPLRIRGTTPDGTIVIDGWGTDH